MQSAAGCGPEICDNIDNDCDQKVDEEVTRPCGPAMMGICKPGTEKCAAGAWTGTCLDAINPGTEMCDAEGLDENCNGTRNENCACTPGTTQACGMKGGICVQGVQTCTAAGQWPTECVGAVLPATEVCDGAMDENCDGHVDEGCECTNGKSMDCGMDIGQCAKGKKTCKDGKWGTTCEGGRMPGTEICDGKDNDCNGRTDEGLLNDCGGCDRLSNPRGSSCSAGQFSCKRTGTYESSGLNLTGCNAVAATGTTDSCDGADNDCDGLTDEGLHNDCGGACMTMLPGKVGGTCRVPGTSDCDTAGTWSCSGIDSMRCEPTCTWRCTWGDGSVVMETKDPCHFMVEQASAVCLPIDANCPP